MLFAVAELLVFIALLIVGSVHLSSIYNHVYRFNEFYNSYVELDLLVYVRLCGGVM